MPNQAEFQRVTENYLKPLLKHFAKTLTEEQIESYVEDLAEFSGEDLSAAKLITRRNNKFFPTISDAINACKESRKFAPKDPQDLNRGFESQRKFDGHRIAQKKYIDNYMKSELFKQAEREKWDSPLRRYVMEAAWVQIQILNPWGTGSNARIGIDSATLDLTLETRGRFIATQRQLCADGDICVEVPAEKIEKWKKEATKPSYSAESKTSVMKSYMQSIGAPQADIDALMASQ